MRTFLLLAAAALGLAACGKNDQTATDANAGENLSTEAIVSNDVTAIDAVTGDAANMAADVDVNFTADQQLQNGTGAKPSSAPRPNSARPGSAPSKPARAPGSTPPPATNTATSNSVG